MSARTSFKSGASSAEARTLTLSCFASAPPPQRQGKQLTLAMPLGAPEDQIVMPGCDDGADPHRVYQPTRTSEAAPERKR
jgi:hypothetical protein